MQKLVFSPSHNGNIDMEEINKLLSKNWKIISIIPQSVSISMTYTSSSKELYGGMLFLLEIDEPENL